MFTRVATSNGTGTGNQTSRTPGISPGNGDLPANLTRKVARPIVSAVLKELRHESNTRGANLQQNALTMGAGYLCPSQGGTAADAFLNALRA
jgi:hypothetical protein